MVSLGGLPDLEEAARPPGSGCGTEVIGRLVGPATLSGRNVFADTSVPRLAPLGVPQVLINGTQDRIIPTAYAEGYAAPMRAAGDDVRVRMIDRTGHVELIAPETAAWAAAVEEIERALRPMSRDARTRPRRRRRRSAAAAARPLPPARRAHLSRRQFARRAAEGGARRACADVVAERMGRLR